VVVFVRGGGDSPNLSCVLSILQLSMLA